ncbi:cytochrome p450 [Hirsutella rhossiliensis]|uniref:Cytochrome p450 domain-containing protein n=1 Tax=Hirsutella rhossiliensis TaxID=111463 RepID=A0A9P8N422_9HYPO|nr:cytochrome p450 domain-containing protein [Hirsutella rhossiliensis]KAH0966460.1 cytochrome p450 domain-containing protein [Hirsutella rhossiliensis]
MLEHLSCLHISLSLGLIVLLFLVRRLYWHPLSQFPGPVLPALTSFYQFYMFWTGQEGEWYSKLHEQYGPVVRCGPNHLCFNEPSMITTVYHRHADKTDFHQEFSCSTAVFNKKSHTDHASAKRRFGHAYSLPCVQLSEHALDDQVTQLMSSLRAESQKAPRVDLGAWIRYFSFDVIAAMSLGIQLGFMDAKGDVRGLIRNMGQTTALQQRLSLYPPIAAFARNNPLGRRLFVSRPTDRRGLGLFMAEIRQVAQQRRACAGKPRYEHSMLDQWLASPSPPNDREIPLQEIEDQLLMDMMAGPDSIALMVTNLVFLIAHDPSIFHRAQAEVDAAFVQGRLSGKVPAYEASRRLPFITACVNEGLRYIASTFPRRRCSPPGQPFSLAGKYVPPGTSVSSSGATIGRHPDLYGDQADQFLPDRWLSASAEQLQEWGRMDVHWGVGVRKCLGKHIGLMALYKAIVMLVRTFDLQLEETTSINKWSYPSSEYMLMRPRAL